MGPRFIVRHRMLHAIARSRAIPRASTLYRRQEHPSSMLSPQSAFMTFSTSTALNTEKGAPVGGTSDTVASGQTSAVTTTKSATPVEDIIRTRISSSLSPTHLEIHNDSPQHAHHAAMRGSTSGETHFRLVIVSDAFVGKPLPARHRMVTSLLKDEMAREGGIHALQLRTLTPTEMEAKK